MLSPRLMISLDELLILVVALSIAALVTLLYLIMTQCPCGSKEQMPAAAEVDFESKIIVYVDPIV